VRIRNGADSRWTAHSRQDATAAGDASLSDSSLERRISKPAGESCRSLRFSIWRLLIEKPGERLQDDRKLLEQPIHTHADVLEILDRATLDLYTMLETLGFRVQVIADVQRAVLGLESDEIAKVLAFACRELVPKLEQAGDEV